MTVDSPAVPAPGALGPSGPPESGPRGPGRTASARSAVRRAGWPLAIAGLLLVAALLTLVTGHGGNGEPFDPDGAGPQGSRAIAQVLSGHGVRVEVVRSREDLTRATEADPTATVLVVRTDLLTTQDVDVLQQNVTARGRSLVLVAPSSDELQRLLPDVGVSDTTRRRVVEARCNAPEAARAGPVDAGGQTFTIVPGPDVAGCYPVSGHPSYVVHRQPGRTVLIGQPALLTNERLAKQGDASLLVGALGTTGSLIWYAPGIDVVAGEQHSLSSLLPRWVGWLALELFAVIGVCMLWRGRRLGRLVTEPLPVVVRAVETTEGRARMYRRSRAHARAATTLREATMTRLRERVGLPRLAPPEALVGVVSARTGIPGADVAAMLLGPPPHDDAGLVHLAQILDQLDREVRRS